MDTGWILLSFPLSGWECMIMFDDLSPVAVWIFDELLKLVRFVWTSGRWLGVGVICLPLIARVIHIFKKIF